MKVRANKVPCAHRQGSKKDPDQEATIVSDRRSLRSDPSAKRVFSYAERKKTGGLAADRKAIVHDAGNGGTTASTFYAKRAINVAKMANNAPAP